MKRKDISILFLHGYPWALSYLLRSLALHFQLFEMVLCVWFFENSLKRGHRCGNLCNDSCLNIYKGVLYFEKIFQCLKVVLKVCYDVWF